MNLLNSLELYTIFTRMKDKVFFPKIRCSTFWCLTLVCTSGFVMLKMLSSRLRWWHLMAFCTNLQQLPPGI